MLIFSPFLASKKVYALDPQGITFVERKNVDSAGTAYTMRSYQIPAVWFSRRSNGRKAAFFGVLWDSERTNDADGVPAVWDLDAFIANCDTGHYGGTPFGCWDGQAAWWGDAAYSNDYAKQQEKLPFLQEMLEAYPAIPAGYEGWFKFV